MFTGTLTRNKVQGNKWPRWIFPLKGLPSDSLPNDGDNGNNQTLIAGDSVIAHVCSWHHVQYCPPSTSSVTLRVTPGITGVYHTASHLQRLQNMPRVTWGRK